MVKRVSGFIAALWLGTFVSYWILSGWGLNYTVQYWESQRRGEPAQIVSLPLYILGGFTGGVSIISGVVTWAIDSSTDNDVPMR